MKNLYVVLLLTLIANIGVAGNKPFTTVNDDPFLQKITRKNQLLKAGANKANAIVYRMVGKRHDLYVTTSASWENSDSAKYYHLVMPSSVTDSCDVYYVYDSPSSTWYPDNQTLYTINGSNQVSQSIDQTWIKSTSTWRISGKYIINYATGGQYSEYTHQNWDTLTSTWVNEIKYTYTYDNNNNNTLTLVQYWDNSSSSWLNNEKVMITYNGNNKPVTSTVQYWDGMGGAWFNIVRDNYVYDTNLDQTEQRTEKWDAINTVWVDNYKHTFAYTSHLLVLDISEDWITSTSVWRNNTKKINTYTGTKRSIYEMQTWDTTVNAWQYNTKNAYSYNTNNRMTLEIDSVWPLFGSSFNPSRKIVMVWDSHNNNTNRESFNWDGMALAFVSLGRTTFQFDANDNNTYRLDENFSGSGYENSEQTFYYYQSFEYTSITETASINELGIFPNPAHGNSGVQVSFTLQNAAQVCINIYGTDGKLVTTETNQYAAGKNNATMKINNLAAGIYYVTFENMGNHENSSLKLSIQ